MALAAIAFLWPAALNGGPFWFPDSSTYIRAADTAVVTVTGSTSEWSDRLVRVPAPPARSETAATASAASGSSEDRAGASEWLPTRPVLTGRSIYYGMLIYLPMRLFGLWGGVIFQSLIVAGLTVGSLFVGARTARADPRLVVAVAVAILTLLTPLPFYTSMLMPDIYSGVLILVLATVLCFWESLSAKARILLIGASAAIATFHTTNILIALAMAGAAFLVLGSRKKSRLRPILVILPVLAVALAGEMAFSHAVKSQLGQEPLSPPFLSARITASGPGTAYLHHHCTGAPDDFALCAHRDRLPLFSDDFLWSEETDTGLFQLVDSREQRRISKEDKAFFLAVFADDPASAVFASAESFVRQLSYFDLENFNYSDLLKSLAPGQLPAAAEAQFRASRAFDGRIPVAFTVAATVAVTLASIATIGILWVRSVRSREGFLPMTLRYALLIVLGVLANALICGALSKPGARYQMRLIWLIPAAAVVTAFAGRRSLGPRGESVDDPAATGHRTTLGATT